MKMVLPRDSARSRTPGLLALSVLLVLAAGSATAQLEPCGFFEIDGVPGYSTTDLHFSGSQWRAAGAFPAVADYNGDGIVNMLDLIQQSNCVDDLAPGLMGKFYGLDIGDPDLNLNFPNFDAISFNPAVIKAVPEFEEFDTSDGFLNSDMVQRFGALFEGFLFVPERATYTLTISGREGMRVVLDGSQILFFDGSPRTDTDSMILEYGLHPIRVEYYSTNRNNSCSLTWFSSGGMVGGTNKTIGPDYLMHETTVVPEHTVTGIEVIFDPPPGSRVDNGLPDVQAWVLAPGGDLSFNLSGKNRVLFDGFMSDPVNLQNLGINRIPYTVNDNNGQTFSGTYELFYDSQAAPNSGLAANIYVPEWYEGAIPPVDGLASVFRSGTPGTHLTRDGANRLFVGDAYVGPKAIVELQGLLETTISGVYEFRLDGVGALFVNGLLVAARGYEYPDQYDVEGTVTLTAGNNHYRLLTGRSGSSPSMDVYWTPPGGTEHRIPDARFRYGGLHFTNPPDFSTGSQTGAGRETPDLVAEYVFNPSDPWADSSGNGYELTPDPRAAGIPTGGIAYRGGGGTTSAQLGSQLVGAMKRDRQLSLEVDFVPDELAFTEQRLLTIQSNGQQLVKLFLNHNDIFFDFYDQDGNRSRLSALDRVTPGNRYHVVGTYNGVVLKLYVNGDQTEFLNANIDVTRWPNLATFSVGQNAYRQSSPGTSGRQMLGKFLGAAAYVRELGPPAIATNRSASGSTVPTPAPFSVPAAPEFPPPGTAQADLDMAHHLLNRMGFGPSPQDLNDVLNMGVGSWIAAQLDPENIDDSALEAALATDMFLPDRYYRDLGGWLTYRMTHSKRQLLEVMAWFWENHFNTEREKVNNLWEEWQENQRFRTLALGEFAQLLEASARNYPMTVYLDSDSNVVGAPNENYAREILELHTFGVDNGYTQTDIEEAARCFTGWTVRNGKFYFNPGLHDYGEKNLLGITIPIGGGISDGITLIDHLVKSPNTADFISFKLCQVFIDDDPPADVRTAVATTFNNTCGDMTATLTTLLNHARFRTDANYRFNKVKTPLEFVVSVLRATESPGFSNGLTHYLDDMGMELFNYADPTGFSEESVDWLDTNAINLRWNFINDVSTNRRNQILSATDMFTLSDRYLFSDYVGIIDFMENITTHGRQSPVVRALAEGWLTDDDPGSFSLTDEVIDLQLRQTLGLYLRLPEFNKQ